MKKLLIVGAMGLLVACGGEEESTEAETPEETTSEETTEETTEPTETAEAEETEEEAEDEEPALPPEPEAASPEAQTEGDVTVSAVQCTVEGGDPIHYDNFSTPGIGVSPDGSTAWLVDQDRKLRKYSIGGEGEQCTLTLDTSFGEGGMLDLGFGDSMGGRVEGVDVDASGNVYVSASMSGAVRVTPSGEITRCDDSRGALSVMDDGSWGVAIFASSARKVTWTDEGCTVEDYEYQEPYERASTFSFTDGHLWIAGSVATNTFRAQRYSLAGAPAGERWGGDELNDPDKICSPGNVVTGSRGPVVLDQNCRSLIVASSNDGEVASRVNAMHLLGLRYPWVENITEPRDGVAYVQASHERGRGTRHYDSYVFRVSGL